MDARGGGNRECRGDSAGEDERRGPHCPSKAAAPSASTPLSIAFFSRSGNRLVHASDGA